ncbi:AAA family ATPase [Rhodovulum sulfidophilum]|uniref:AAA family ATPase n=1 Tax=Rhodovulum sulfidophilum TaxID=35806 RepID=UPI001F286558|nr:AAA family ATPase [Rhodovulum sulfidophilum]MCE8440226.1 AAA family ATPase [Rhodovulum sulfidophilum]
MYVAFFGLAHRPFGPAPCQGSLHWTDPHWHDFERLRLALIDGAPLALVLGRPGTGKTTFLRALLRDETLTDIFRPAFHTNPTGDGPTLLRWILSAFGAEAGAADPDRLLARVGTVLAEIRAAGRLPLLAIDEAQGLSAAGLQMLDRVARPPQGARQGEDTALQIVLAGLPDLEPHLEQSHPPLLGLSRDSTVRLQPMTAAETADYIRSRIVAAEGDADALFDAGALALIHDHAHGLPRLVNTICDRSLNAAFGAGRTRLDGAFIREVLAEWNDSGDALCLLECPASSPPRAPQTAPPGARPRPVAQPPPPDAAAVASIPPPPISEPLSASSSVSVSGAVSAPGPSPAPPPRRRPRGRRLLAASTGAGLGLAAVFVGGALIVGLPSGPGTQIDATSPRLAGAGAVPESRRAARLPDRSQAAETVPGAESAQTNSTETGAAAERLARTRTRIEAAETRLADTLSELERLAARLRDATKETGAAEARRDAARDAAKRAEADFAQLQDRITEAELRLDALDRRLAEGDADRLTGLQATAAAPTPKPGPKPRPDPAPAPVPATSPLELDAAPPDPRVAQRQYRHALGSTDPLDIAIAYSRAAVNGQSRAAYYLGQIYEVGDGVERDIDTARQWYRIAAAEVAAAQVRLEDLPEGPADPDRATARPLASSRSEGVIELVWQGSGPFVVELAAEPGPPEARFATALTAARLALPARPALLWWRIRAGRSAPTDWQRIDPR